MSIIEVLKIYKQKFDADFCTNVIWDSINDQDIAMLYNDNNEIIFLKKGTINILYSIYLTTHYKNVDIEVSLYLNDIYIENSIRLFNTCDYNTYIFPYTAVLPVTNIKIEENDKLELIIKTNKKISSFCDNDDLKINSLTISFLPDVVLPTTL